MCWIYPKVKKFFPFQLNHRRPVGKKFQLHCCAQHHCTHEISTPNESGYIDHGMRRPGERRECGVRRTRDATRYTLAHWELVRKRPFVRATRETTHALDLLLQTSAPYQLLSTHACLIIRPAFCPHHRHHHRTTLSISCPPLLFPPPTIFFV